MYVIRCFNLSTAHVENVTGGIPDPWADSHSGTLSPADRAARETTLSEFANNDPSDSHVYYATEINNSPPF